MPRKRIKTHHTVILTPAQADQIRAKAGNNMSEFLRVSALKASEPGLNVVIDAAPPGDLAAMGAR